MRVESIAKKVSCTVVKTSLLNGAGRLSVSKPQEEYCRTAMFVPIIPINLPKRALDMTVVLSEYASKGRFLDYYA
jgi:hypothetical protein